MLFLREANQDWRLWRHNIPDEKVVLVKSCLSLIMSVHSYQQELGSEIMPPLPSSNIAHATFQNTYKK